jgi:uncharacterized membrane protein
MKKIKLIFGTLMISLPIVAADSYGGNHMSSFGWPMMLTMGLFWTLFWIGIFYLVYELIKTSRKKNQESRPLNIAKKRLASGELSIKEFDKIKKELK